MPRKFASVPIFFGSFNAAAQTVTATGTVVDSSTGEPLIGAVVLLKAKSSTDHVITDLDGRFSLKAPAGSVLEISLMGYETLEVKAAASMGKIALVPDVQTLDEVQVIAYGKQSKLSITGAITSIGTSELLKSPAGSAASALAGAVTGISTVQTSGQPGADDPQIFVRGTGSLSNTASSPLILVDGVERSFFQMDPNEIESITVLKDASSTAVFGVRGANGVILVTTRRGAEEKMSISVSSQFGLTQALRKLTCVDSYTYATLFTEAQKSDGVSDKNLIFSDYVTERFRQGDEPIMFPNVNWQKEVFKDFSWQTQHNVTLSGGGKRFRYFVSLGYMHQDGVLKQNYETFNSNFRYDRFNYRTNVDVNLTKTTLLKLNIGGRLGSRKEPQNEDLWRTVMWCVPFSSPGFVDGKLIQNGFNPYIPIGETKSPYDYYYNWGLYTTNQNVLNLDLAIEQNLDFVTKGLSVQVKGAYNTTHSVTILRSPTGTDSTWIPIYKEWIFPTLVLTTLSFTGPRASATSMSLFHIPRLLPAVPETGISRGQSITAALSETTRSLAFSSTTRARNIILPHIPTYRPDMWDMSGGLHIPTNRNICLTSMPATTVPRTSFPASVTVSSLPFRPDGWFRPRSG